MGEMFNKKFIIAALLAFLIVIGWDYFFLKDIREAEAVVVAKNAKVSSLISQNGTSSFVSGNQTSSSKLSSFPRIDISNSSISGSFSLQAGRIDDISLLHYKETLDKDSQNIHMFNKKGTYRAYFFESGWLSSSNIDLPDGETLWSLEKSSATSLTPKTPVNLFWKNSQGITFKKTISIDDSYMISIKDVVINNSGNDLTINPFSLIVRHGDPMVEDMFISHEGYVGYVGKSLERLDYKDVLKENYDFNTTGGYVGFTDKYWLAAIVIDKDESALARYISYKDSQKIDNFQVDAMGTDIKLANGEQVESISRVFVGPKEYKTLNEYDNMYNIGKFNDTIDFGWFFFFTKPMIQFLLFIQSIIGNFGFSILVFTVIIRAVILPIAYKSYVSMAKMKELQPKMKELKELYKGDMQKYNKEIANLYKKEKVNPLSGCLPLLLQIPIFFSIYKVIFISIEMRQAPFIGWVQDMSVMDPSNLFTLFGLIPITLPVFLHIGAWPIFMGVTMFFQQKLSNTQSLEPMQQKIMNMMPFVLVIVLGSFPVGLVIYWTWSNIISIIQQLIINKKVHNEFGLKNLRKKKVQAK